MTPAALLSFLTLALSSAGAAAPIPPAGAANPDLSAPVTYRDLMLVLVTKDGAAAVIFRNQSADGDEIDYSFRYEAADGTKKEGTGKLFERRLKVGLGGFDPAGLSLVAGPISITWSKGNADRGWIYYAPEVVTVHLAHADNFKGGPRKIAGQVVTVKELDLRRFMKK